MISFWVRLGIVAVLMLACFLNVFAQSANLPDAPSRQTGEDSSVRPESSGYLQPGEDPDNHLFLPFAKHIIGDQKEFWTQPAHFQVKDLRWGLPFAGATAALIASDSWISKQVPNRPSQLKHSKDVSNYAVYSLVGLGGASYLFGNLTRNDHLAETGLLSGEAAIDSTAVAYAFKELTQRPRPYLDGGKGTFFQGGSSFPSEHSAIAWSVAGVWAHEYPGWLSRTMAYGLASAVTLTRVTSQQHFASDAFIGSALGWYFARQVYRAHHDVEIGGTSWGSPMPDHGGDKIRNPEDMGSPYVPIDSWIYPAFERLIALGYINSAYIGMRPWTRMECARLLDEASDSLQNEDASSDAQKLYNALADEFAPETRRLGGAENLGASIDSVYTRTTAISGTPLRDSYHFGQTIVNDYGRPYGEGFNNVTGFTSHAVAGSFSVFVQGEYEYAPATPSYPTNVLDMIASAEEQTLPTPNAVHEVSRLKVLDSQVAFTYRNIQFSFGNQSLWLGPGAGSSFLSTDNAAPIPMFRMDQTSPLYIPGLSRILGPLRAEFFLGRLSGQQWIFSNGILHGPNITDQPFIHGEKIGFKPTKNLEFGMGASTIFGGIGQSVTWQSFLRTFTSAGLASNGLPGTAEDPGDRRATADITYKVPHLRDWLTFYADSFVEDEISPIGSSRPALITGLYLPKVPKLPKLDFRVESVYTDVPHTPNVPGNIYANGRFRSGYTNDGSIIGSWVGRDGKGGQAWATYWFSPRSVLQAFYRHQTVSQKFLEGGGLNDFGIRAEYGAAPDISLQGIVQYESWKFPVLSPTSKSDVTASLQLTFQLHRR